MKRRVNEQDANWIGWLTGSLDAFTYIHKGRKGNIRILKNKSSTQMHFLSFTTKTKYAFTVVILFDI